MGRNSRRKAESRANPQTYTAGASASSNNCNEPSNAERVAEILGLISQLPKAKSEVGLRPDDEIIKELFARMMNTSMVIKLPYNLQARSKEIFELFNFRIGIEEKPVELKNHDDLIDGILLLIGNNWEEIDELTVKLKKLTSNKEIINELRLFSEKSLAKLTDSDDILSYSHLSKWLIESLCAHTKDEVWEKEWVGVRKVLFRYLYEKAIIDDSYKHAKYLGVQYYQDGVLNLDHENLEIYKMLVEVGHTFRKKFFSDSNVYVRYFDDFRDKMREDEDDFCEKLKDKDFMIDAVEETFKIDKYKAPDVSVENLLEAFLQQDCVIC